MKLLKRIYEFSKQHKVLAFLLLLGIIYFSGYLVEVIGDTAIDLTAKKRRRIIFSGDDKRILTGGNLESALALLERKLEGPGMLQKAGILHSMNPDLKLLGIMGTIAFTDKLPAPIPWNDAWITWEHWYSIYRGDKQAVRLARLALEKNRIAFSPLPSIDFRDLNQVGNIFLDAYENSNYGMAALLCEKDAEKSLIALFKSFKVTIKEVLPLPDKNQILLRCENPDHDDILLLLGDSDDDGIVSVEMIYRGYFLGIDQK
ncbi:hypothetical protein BVX99_02520 [bacterium F16]|nr:hypothetical protein BVX99_02520 [bacterium F16]